MATVAASRLGSASPCCSLPVHNNVPAMGGGRHEEVRAIQNSRNRRVGLTHGNGRRIRVKNGHCSSWPLRGKRQGIVACCSGSGNSQQRAEDFSNGTGGAEALGLGVGDENGKGWETIWRKITSTMAAVLLSAVISLPLPLPGGGDYNSVLAEEMTLEAPSVSETVPNDPECSGRALIGVEEESGSQEPEPVTNESVVEEAWQVVKDNFLDARHHSWSAENWARVKEEILLRPIRSRMAAYGCIKAMLSSLGDPYTRFLTPDQFRELSKYDVTGVGLNIGELENKQGQLKLAVLGIVLGSPAQMMGVRQGDELVAVNGIGVEGLSAFEASSLIQGPKGTPVSIQIRHGPCEDVKDITVPRQNDVRTPVYYRLEHTKDPAELVGYIRLREFNALAKKDLVIAMKRLQEAGATSFLLDLQDNPGGLVQAGIEIARIFLDGGETVIQTVGRDPAKYRKIMASGVPLTKAPLMVLVNNRTASASEIVAAALHDNCRAILVGNRTFGKGLIQSVYELSDGSGLILTVGKYVTPGKVDIDGNGIEPDFKNPPDLSEAKQKLGSCALHLKEDATAAARL